MKHKPLPSIDLLRETFILAPESPTGLKWREPRYPRKAEFAGFKQYSQHRVYWSVFFQGQAYKCHRIVWAITNGSDPAESEIDHIDVNPSSNVASNLRKATHSQNQQNSRAYRTNTSGFKGVTWHKRQRKWISQITLNGRHMHIGSFATREAAAEAYKEACARLHKDFARAA